MSFENREEKDYKRIHEFINRCKKMVEVPEEVDNEDLVFPHARIVNMVREKTEEGQYVRKSDRKSVV